MACSESQSSNNVLLLTQNIGSIECNTEEVTVQNQELTVQWAESVAAFVKQAEERCQHPVDLLVIHLQEIGGKKFNQAFNDYLRSVVHRCWPDASWCSGLLGPTQNDTTTFTAMGSAIFLRQHVAPLASIWSFGKQEFLPVTEAAAADDIALGAKFSNVGTSRKGYLLTSLRLGPSTILNFMNLHLSHDADNTVAASQPHPSEYVLTRAGALTEAMEATRGLVDENPLFLFGDLNLRLDTHRLKTLLEEKVGEPITLEKKKIHCSQKAWDFLQSAENWPTLKDMDKDGSTIQTVVSDKADVVLEELPVKFGPTYLLEDDSIKARSNTRNDGVLDGNNNGSRGDDVALKACYQQSRFPAWCDRFWFNPAGKGLLDSKAVYWTAPLHPMDHLPVYLRFQIPITTT